MPVARVNIFGVTCDFLIIVTVAGAIVMKFGESRAQDSPDTESHSQIEQPITLVTIADARSGVANRIDLGEPGESRGDLFVFDQPLLNSKYESIGTNSGYCIRTVPGKFSECRWTLTLANGTVTVAGRESDSGTSLIPVVDGTGDYLMVSGVMATTPNGDKTFTQILTLYPIDQLKASDSVFRKPR